VVFSSFSALDVLVGKNKVLEKIYGKQKVFAIVQESVDEEMVSRNCQDCDGKSILHFFF
jgi:26S proteasome regulatory subunit, ATPase 3, interacting protein